MRLLVDAGNSRLKWAWARDEQVLIRPGVLAYGDEAYTEAISKAWRNLPVPKAVIGVSVAAPAVWSAIEHWCANRWGLYPKRLQSPAQGAGVRLGYREPTQLGADRWAAMAGAVALNRLPACIVDCGTAVTLDLIDDGGLHQGGLIVPGLATMRRSLTARTHQLPAVEEGALTLFARDTITAIRSGTLMGLAAMVEQLSVALTASLPCRSTRLLTGGDAGVLLAYLGEDFEHVPDLVLRGVARIAGESPG